MGIKQDFGPLTFGFDIGIASVGWAVLSPKHIVDLGVRCFDKAETAKEGESLNLARRTARLTRNRLKQRAWRLQQLARHLKKIGLIASPQSLTAPQPALAGAWQLRVAGLDRLLTNDEWARVIYHLCKHRGFHWQSRAEAKQVEGDEKSEGGKVKQGLAKTKALLTEKNYRSAAEMVLGEFPEAQRNKDGDYGKALSRDLLGQELTLLFNKQRNFGNAHAGTELELVILGSGDKKSGLFWLQKPPLSGENLLKMIGKCTLEKTEYRAPKASFTVERHVWLTRLTNIRLVVDGRTRGLNESEWRTALTLPYESAEKFTYKHLRKALEKLGLDSSFKFTGLSYPSQSQKEAEKAKDPEAETLIKLPAWHDLKSLLKKANLESEWLQISTAAVEGNPEILDQIAWILSVYKEDEEAAFELKQLHLPNAAKLIDALLYIRFDKFHSLSLKALKNILPHMEHQLRYDEACEKAGYHHSQLFKIGAGKDKYLPPLYSGRDKSNRMIFNTDIGDIPRNPVVLRSLNQARKVLNALVAKYGSPSSVHIEMARDLSRAFAERNKIKKEQDAFRDRNDKDKSTFMSELGVAGAARGGDFDKWRLYREQMGKCAYSLNVISVERLLEPGYVESDHALPYSRSFDDSKNNKVLVLAIENRNKGNRTPYEYLDGANNSERWRMFVAFVESNKTYRMAKRSRLLRKDFGKDESQSFRDRNLNDTRYICKFFKNQVEQFLKLAEGSEEKRCVVLSGQLTSFLRARWGLIKIRDESDRHHALDAVVVAACSHGMVKRLSDYSRRKELQNVADGFVDTETGEIVNPTLHDKLKAHFPEPWEYFRDEVQVRLKMNDVTMMRDELLRIGSYTPVALALAKPLFVSRAPMRRSGGAAHKETIYGQHPTDKGAVTEKARLSSITLKDLDRAVDPHRNEKLYEAIRKRLAEHGNKADKAFTLDNPLRKPDCDGKPTGPIVRTITLVIDKLTGIPVRNGIAKNDTMLRADVFTKAGKFHLVPVYVHHRATGLPSRAIVHSKDESEWTLIDDSFTWCFSICPNDFIVVRQKGKDSVAGYFSSCHRGTGAINLWAHDRDKLTGKDGLIESIGVKTAVSVEKFHVDTLGNLYPAKLEPRRGLA
jgi:CRISPR-associated endonuclease Csn1